MTATPEPSEPIPKLTRLSLAAMPCSALVDFLIAETFDEAVFSMISAITVFGIEDKDDAAIAMERDPSARHWAEMTALAIPEPYQQNASVKASPKTK